MKEEEKNKNILNDSAMPEYTTSSYTEEEAKRIDDMLHYIVYEAKFGKNIRYYQGIDNTIEAQTDLIFARNPDLAPRQVAMEVLAQHPDFVPPEYVAYIVRKTCTYWVQLQAGITHRVQRRKVQLKGVIKWF